MKNRFSQLFFLALVLCAAAASLGAQNVPLPPPGGGNGVDLGVTIADITVDPGEFFELVFDLNHPLPVSDFFFAIDSMATSCQFLSVELGEGIDAYATANGSLPPGQCDIIVTPEAIQTFMFFQPVPYEVSSYGTEIYRIHAVAGQTPGETALSFFAWSSFGESSVGVVKVTIADPSVPETPGLMRGDVNLDASCNLTDAILMLDYLYLGNFDAPCADSCDVDDSGSVNLADAVNLLSGLFGGGFPLDDTCQLDSTEDNLAECLDSPCP